MRLAVLGCRGGTPAVIGHGWPAFDLRGGTTHRACTGSCDAVLSATRRGQPTEEPAFFALRPKDFLEDNQSEGLYIMHTSIKTTKRPPRPPRPARINNCQLAREEADWSGTFN